MIRRCGDERDVMRGPRQIVPRPVSRRFGKDPIGPIAPLGETDFSGDSDFLTCLA